MTAEDRSKVVELRSRGMTKLRENDMFAFWVKTACCNMNSRQLRKLADITEKYGRGYLLFTTRQIPIIPFINISDDQKVQAELREVDLILDRCGPTVRNVNVCYDDKICPEAVTNSLSLGEKLDNFFHTPMGHKVKIGVAGCQKDCPISRVLTDISFIGVERNGRTGYDAYVGGRLGLKPFVGVKMAECLPEEACVRFVQNYFDLLNRNGKKDERAADIVVRLGESRVREELTRDLERESGLAPIRCATRLEEETTDKTILKIRATCGEVTASQLRKIADIAETYGKGFVHFSVRGAPEVPGISERQLGMIRRELAEAGLAILDRGIDNLQSCFGGYCTENNVDPQSLLRKVEKLVADLDMNNLNIKISAGGCPNSCAIAHLNDLGFYGVLEPEVVAANCTGCQLCVPVCKTKAIEVRDGLAVIDKEKCHHCGQCLMVCPFEAIAEKRKGFAVLVGGREGAEPRLGEIMAEFLSEDDALEVTERCLRLMREQEADVAAIVDEFGLQKLRELLVPAAKLAE